MLIMKNAVLIFLRDTAKREPHHFLNNDETLKFVLQQFSNEEMDAIHRELDIRVGNEKGNTCNNILLFVQPRKSDFIYCGRLKRSSDISSSNIDMILDLIDIERIRGTKETRIMFRNFVDTFSAISSYISEIPINEVSGYDADNLPMPGSFVGGTKESCMKTVIDPSSTSEDSEIVYNTRSGVIELANMVLFFINSATCAKHKHRKYRNDFLSHGREVTFMLDSSKENEVFLYDSITTMKSIAGNQSDDKSLFLFVRSSNGGKFIFCGLCKGEPMQSRSNKSKQLRVLLHLLEYDTIVADSEGGSVYLEMVSMHMKALASA